MRTAKRRENAGQQRGDGQQGQPRDDRSRAGLLRCEPREQQQPRAEQGADIERGAAQSGQRLRLKSSI